MQTKDYQTLLVILRQLSIQGADTCGAAMTKDVREVDDPVGMYKCLQSVFKVYFNTSKWPQSEPKVYLKCL
jgi:hypothetical protein